MSSGPPKPTVEKEDPPAEIFASKANTGTIQAKGSYDLDSLLEKYGASEEVEITDADIDLAKVLVPKGARGMRLRGYEKAAKEEYVTAENWSYVLRALKGEDTLRVNDFCAGLKAAQPYLHKNLAAGFQELIPRVLQTYDKASNFQKAILTECVSLFVGLHPKNAGYVLEQIMLCFQPPSKTKSRVGAGASGASGSARKKEPTPPGTKFHEDISELLHTLYQHYGNTVYTYQMLKANKVFQLLSSTSVGMRRHIKMIVLYVYVEQGVLFKEYIEKICADLNVNKTTQQEIVREMGHIDDYITALREKKNPSPIPYHIKPTRTVQGLAVEAVVKQDPLAIKGPEIDFFKQLLSVFENIEAEKAKAAAMEADMAGSSKHPSAPTATATPTPFGDAEGKKDWQYDMDKSLQVVDKYNEYKHATFIPSPPSRVDGVFAVVRKCLASSQNGVKMAGLSAIKTIYSDIVLFSMCLQTISSSLPALLNLFMDKKAYMHDITQDVIGVMYSSFTKLVNVPYDRMKQLQHFFLRDFYTYCLKNITTDDSAGKKAPTHFITALLHTAHSVLYYSDVHETALFRPLDPRVRPVFHKFIELTLKLTDALDDKVRRETMVVVSYYKQILPPKLWKAYVLDKLKTSEKRLLLLEKACMSAQRIRFYDEVMGDAVDTQGTQSSASMSAPSTSGGPGGISTTTTPAPTTETRTIVVQEFSYFYHHKIYPPPVLSKLDWKTVEEFIMHHPNPFATPAPPLDGGSSGGDQLNPDAQPSLTPTDTPAKFSVGNATTINELYAYALTLPQHSQPSSQPSSSLPSDTTPTSASTPTAPPIPPPPYITPTPANTVYITYPPFSTTTPLTTPPVPATDMPPLPIVVSSIQQAFEYLRDILLYSPTLPKASASAIAAISSIEAILTSSSPSSYSSSSSPSSSPSSGNEDDDIQDEEGETLSTAFSTLFLATGELHPIHQQHYLRILVHLFTHIYGPNDILSHTRLPWDHTAASPTDSTQPGPDSPSSSSDVTNTSSINGNTTKASPRAAPPLPLWYDIITTLNSPSIQASCLSVPHATALLHTLYSTIQAYPADDPVLLQLLLGLSLHTPMAILLGYFIVLFHENTKLTQKIEHLMNATTSLATEYNIFNHTGIPSAQACDKLILALASQVFSASAASSLQKLSLGLFAALYQQALLTPRDASVPSIENPPLGDDGLPTTINTFGPLLNKAIIRSAGNPMIGRKIKAELDAVDKRFANPPKHTSGGDSDKDSDKSDSVVVMKLNALKPIPIKPFPVTMSDSDSQSSSEDGTPSTTTAHTITLPVLPPATKSIDIVVEVSPPTPPQPQPQSQQPPPQSTSSFQTQTHTVPYDEYTTDPYDDYGEEEGQDTQQQEDTVPEGMREFFGQGPSVVKRPQQTRMLGRQQQHQQQQQRRPISKPPSQKQQQQPRSQPPQQQQQQQQQRRPGHPPQQHYQHQQYNHTYSPTDNDHRFDLNTSLSSIISNIQSRDPLKREQALNMVLSPLKDEYTTHSQNPEGTSPPPHILTEASIDTLVNPLLVCLNDPVPKNQVTAIHIFIYLFCTYDLEVMKHYRVILPLIVKASSSRRLHTEAIHILRIASDLYRFSSIFTSVLSGVRSRGDMQRIEAIYDFFYEQFTAFREEITMEQQQQQQQPNFVQYSQPLVSMMNQIQSMAANSDLVGVVVDGHQHRLHEIRSAASRLLLLLSEIADPKRFITILQRARATLAPAVIKYIRSHNKAFQDPSGMGAGSGVGGTRRRSGGQYTTAGGGGSLRDDTAATYTQQGSGSVHPSVFKSDVCNIQPPGGNSSGESMLKSLLPADISLIKDHIKQIFTPNITNALLSASPATINSSIEKLKQYALLMVPSDQSGNIPPQCFHVLRQHMSHLDVIVRYCAWKLLDSPTATVFAIYAYISALFLSIITTSQLILDANGDLPQPLEACISEPTVATFTYAITHRHTSMTAQTHNDFTTRIIFGYLINFSSALRLITFLLSCAQTSFSGSNSSKTTELLTLTYYVILDSNTARCVPENFLHVIYPLMNCNDQGIRAASMSVLSAWFIQAVQYDERMDVPTTDRLTIDKVIHMSAIDPRFKDSLVKILTAALNTHRQRVLMQQQQQQQLQHKTGLASTSTSTTSSSAALHDTSLDQRQDPNNTLHAHNTSYSHEPSSQQQADIRFGVNLRQDTESLSSSHAPPPSSSSSSSSSNPNGHPFQTPKPTGRTTDHSIHPHNQQQQQQRYPTTTPIPPSTPLQQPPPPTQNGLLLLPFIIDYADILTHLHTRYNNNNHNRNSLDVGVGLFSHQPVDCQLRVIQPPSPGTSAATTVISLIDTTCKRISNPLASYHPAIMNVQQTPRGGEISNNDKVLMVLHNYGQDIEVVIMLLCFSMYSCFYPHITQTFPQLTQLLTTYIKQSTADPLSPEKDVIIGHLQDFMSNILHQTFIHVANTTAQLQRSPSGPSGGIISTDAVAVTKIGQSIVAILLSPILEQSLSYLTTSLTLRTCTMLLVSQTFICSLTTPPSDGHSATPNAGSTPAHVEQLKQTHHQNDIALRAINKVLITMLQSSCFNYSLHIILISLIESTQSLCENDTTSGSSTATNDPTLSSVMTPPWSKLVTLNARCLSKLAKVIRSKQIECIEQTQQETTNFFDYQAIFPSLHTLFSISDCFAPFSEQQSITQLPPLLHSNAPKIKQGISDLFACFQLNKTREQCIAALDDVPSSSPLVFSVLKYFEQLTQK